MYMATQADGILVTAGQIYVSSLDAAPREEDIISGVASIQAGEITADELTVSNLVLSGELSATGDLELSGFTNVARFTSTQIGIGVEDPSHDFQVGTDRFVIDRTVTNLVTVKGNVASTNVITSNILRTTNSKFLVDSVGSNVLKITGNTYSTNAAVGNKLVVGDNGDGISDVANFKNGNVVIESSNLNVTGDIVVAGNVSITDTLTYLNAENLIVANACIQMANGYPGGQYDNALIMTDHPGEEANLVIGYSATDKEFIFAKTFDSAHTFGGPGEQTITLDSNVVNVHVYGTFFTDSNVGVANADPLHTLCVGSNVFFEDTGSNVLHATGNVYMDRLTLGDGGITSTNELLQIDETSSTPVVFGSNVQMVALRTVGTYPSGVSNLSPIDDFSVGTKVFANLTAANVLTVVGNTVTTNLETQIIFSDSTLTVHADHAGPDSTSNVLVLKSGPTASNVSSIEVFGASTSDTHQNIRFKTKNTERVRIASTGKVGIANTNPSEALTVSGNIHVTGSNAVIYGTGGMKMYSDPAAGVNKIENIVNAGKGLNIFASQTSTMGTAKVTILENSNVGIGTTQPEGLFQTSGGSAFINQQPIYRNSFVHLGTPLVVTNTQPINNTTPDLANVMHLTREGTSTRDGVRATFKMGKYDNTLGKSKSKLDIFLADDRYTDETEVLTLRADGRVGIGTTQPSAHLEVYSTGTGNPTTNGILVHNHDSTKGDSIISLQTNDADGNAFTSYIQSDNDSALTGWAVGVAGTSSDFRITENYQEVSDSAATIFYIDGANSNVGIRTDVTRAEFEVNGNVVIGNKLTFSGLTGDEFGNTLFVERRYTEAQPRNELILFKGNESSSTTGPDRIRHIAAQHAFQTYNTDGQDFDTILSAADSAFGSSIPLLITPSGRVVIGGTDTSENEAGVDASTKLIVGGNIVFTGGGSLQVAGIEFETTSGGGTSINKIRSALDGTTRRPMTFTHQVTAISDEEYARFDDVGRLGIGTDAPTSNLHIYSSTTDDVNMLRLESPGVNKHTGMLIYTNDGEGGFIRGFSDTDNATTGLVMGVANNTILTNCIHVIQTSNVGIGTAVPDTKFHVYNGTPRVEHASSNAVIEFKTTGGTSNILSDTLGNVYINPLSTHVVLNSNTTINGALDVTGAIDLGDAVAINLSGATANTALHVNGGVITNSDQVACKKYSHTFTRGSGQSNDIQLRFDDSAFYTKVIAVAREIGTSNVSNMSTMILELQGGTHDGTTSSVDIALGTKKIFGGTNPFPWSSTVTTGINGVLFEPYVSTPSVQYSFDLSVELTTSRDGKFLGIYTNNSSGVDNFEGTELVTFDY
ncbi:hypothetical protein MpV1_066 [Micromonas sp. RCC1109 virus MpV1]|uniref:hypothetical protein n=1 Tax=Micromonas sp. RCC1109 virus MpV1 TaxID=880161 RepID=UPI0001EF4489|nr:hypothetical protein MpV1_066 [Micromonas sp. RCC1109 virus MpV1]ADQ90989.1 hypothetical protein MpV1_066 [Micromonas sp. RCC1109 virus MpV1]